jgi:adenylate cyclase
LTDKTKDRQIKSINPLFSIGAKLVFIVTLIVVISLGSITALVSWLVRQDLQISAEDSNFEANRRSALEADETLVKMRSDILIITQMLTSAGVNTSLGAETIDFFFEQNPRIAALFFYTRSGQDPSIDQNSSINQFVNERFSLTLDAPFEQRFFQTREIDPFIAETYIENNQVALSRAAFGETLILNAAPHFRTNLFWLRVKSIFFN